MKTLKAIIFDVDGTLAETERDGHLPAFNAAFADYGLNWHWYEALYGQLLDITGGKERIRHFAKNFAPEVFARPDFDDLVRQLHQAKTAHYVRLVDAGHLPLRPGVARLINEARAAGIRLAIATTTTPENVTALLRASLSPEAPSWFEVIGAGDVVAAKKPAPDIYLWVLERLGLPRHRFVTITLKKPASLLWTMEEALKSGAVAAVLGDAEAAHADLTTTRRLSLAAAAGKCAAILTFAKPDASATASHTRWTAAAVPSSSPAHDAAAPGGPCWNIELTRARGGRPGAWTLEWHHAQSRFSLVPGFSRRAIHPGTDQDGPEATRQGPALRTG